MKNFESPFLKYHCTFDYNYLQLTSAPKIIFSLWHFSLFEARALAKESLKEMQEDGPGSIVSKCLFDLLSRALRW